MTPNSLRWSVEELVIQICRLNPAIAPVRFNHHNDVGPAATDIITAKATVGNQNLEGCQPFDVEVTLTYVAAKTTQVQSESVLQAIYSSLYAANPLAVSALESAKCFSFFELLQDSSSDAQNMKKSRKNFVTIQTMAKLK
jgi:hypothetical protein